MSDRSQTQSGFISVVYGYASKLIPISIFYFSTWCATQYIVIKGGARIAALGQAHFYSCIVWTFLETSQSQSALIQQGQILGIVLLFALLFSFFGLEVYFKKRISSASDTRSSRWASHKEIKEAGFIDQSDGIILGKHEEGIHTYTLRDNSKTHVLLIGPTDSGKGAGLVVPTLFSWKGTVIVHDLKSDNWEKTSFYRKNILNQNVFFFDPKCSDGAAARFNPLAEIRQGVNEVRDTQIIVDMIVDPRGEGKNDHWTKTADFFLVGAILHILYAHPDKTLNGLFSVLNDFKRTPIVFIDSMIKTIHDPDGEMGWTDGYGNPTRTHPVVALAAQNMRNKHEEEFASVISTASSHLSLFMDPLLKENTSKSDFKISDLLWAKKPSTLYLRIAPSDRSRLLPLTRLIVNQICMRLMEETEVRRDNEDSQAPHKVLMLLDEFTNLGRITSLEEILSFARGYGIRMFLICQDPSQLKKVYGDSALIVSQCKTKVCFAPNSFATAKEISNLAGEQVVIKTSKSFSNHNANVNENASEGKQSLIAPDEAMRMSKDQELIFVEGMCPIKAKKITYYRDPVFKEAITSRCVEISDRIPERLEFVRFNNVTEWGRTDMNGDLLNINGQCQGV